jgi:hypothetical protein
VVGEMKSSSPELVTTRVLLMYETVRQQDSSRPVKSRPEYCHRIDIGK